VASSGTILIRSDHIPIRKMAKDSLVHFDKRSRFQFQDGNATSKRPFQRVLLSSRNSLDLVGHYRRSECQARSLAFARDFARLMSAEKLSAPLRHRLVLTMDGNQPSLEAHQEPEPPVAALDIRAKHEPPTGRSGERDSWHGPTSPVRNVHLPTREGAPSRYCEIISTGGIQCH
jgi:hypothetical protein